MSSMLCCMFVFFFSSRRRHTRCALVTGVQTCALPIFQPLSADDAAIVSKWLRVALAAEASGLLHAAIASAVEHLSLRKQFGRPLGTFQALRHRKIGRASCRERVCQYV